MPRRRASWARPGPRANVALNTSLSSTLTLSVFSRLKMKDLPMSDACFYLFGGWVYSFIPAFFFVVVVLPSGFAVNVPPLLRVCLLAF